MPAISCRRQCILRSHAQAHFVGHAVVAHDLRRIPKTASLALHDEIPKGAGCLRQQLPAFSSLRQVGLIWRRSVSVEVLQRGERDFELSTESTERCRLLAGNFIGKCMVRTAATRGPTGAVWIHTSGI